MASRLSEELDRRLDDLLLVFFDVETTGLNPHFGDRVCEVAAVRCRSGRELAAYHSLVDPHREISPGAFRVNRITPTDLAGAPDFGDIARELLAMFEDAVMVAHNAPFDLGFLAAELSRLQRKVPPLIVLDTLAIARSAFHFPSNALQRVADHLDLRTKQRHRALDDVRLTARVFEILTERLRNRGVRTLADLLHWQGGEILPPPQHYTPLPPTIQEALSTDGVLRIRYVSAKGEDTTRMVKPRRVTERQDYLYLEAHCYLREALRVFRLDRILEMENVLSPKLPDE